jgi:hypothetical protein
MFAVGAGVISWLAAGCPDLFIGGDVLIFGAQGCSVPT